MPLCVYVKGCPDPKCAECDRVDHEPCWDGPNLADHVRVKNTRFAAKEKDNIKYGDYCDCNQANCDALPWKFMKGVVFDDWPTALRCARSPR